MDNSVSNLIKMLEPLIIDLEEKKNILAEKKQELENISRLLAYTNDNLDMVSIYADQDLILNSLDKVGSNKDEYKASGYLLKSENENVKNLPQYEKACDLIRNILDYFKKCKSSLIMETLDMEKICQKKEIEKKYYDVFSNPYPFIENVSEFENFIDEHDISGKDKIDILIYAIKNNALKYERKSS